MSTPAGTVARIGPIYTPEPQRGRGYGTAITHEMAAALAQECAIVMLYTDAANATSNSIYAQLGFVEVAGWVEVRLEPTDGGLRSRREPQADRVDAVAQVGGRAVALAGEDVAKVRAAGGAADLDALHAH